jgi:hypothetical protein
MSLTSKIINSKVKSITKKKSKKHTSKKTKTLRRIVRDIKQHSNDKFIDFLDDYKNILINGKKLNYLELNEEIFKSNLINCICENIFKKHVDKTCRCKQIKTFSSQGFSGAEIHSIKCDINSFSDDIFDKNIKKKQSQFNNLILKTIKQDDYYLQHKYTSNKYYFIEVDRFSIQVLINKYVNLHLPNNTIYQYNNGFCTDNDKKSIVGYNLMEIADLGSADKFVKNIIKGINLKLKYNKKLNVKNCRNTLSGSIPRLISTK